MAATWNAIDVSPEKNDRFCSEGLVAYSVSCAVP